MNQWPSLNDELFQIRTMLLMTWLAVTVTLIGPNVTTINFNEDSTLRYTNVPAYIQRAGRSTD